ncbi:MAG: hypothetical protein K0S38_482 [Candidatus Paceibacter sp.]|jgi:hypothetical protein|nr:hypothetical protein [Candidatus Paceibacter sp.]
MKKIFLYIFTSLVLVGIFFAPSSPLETPTAHAADEAYCFYWKFLSEQKYREFCAIEELDCRAEFDRVTIKYGTTNIDAELCESEVPLNGELNTDPSKNDVTPPIGTPPTPPPTPPIGTPPTPPPTPPIGTPPTPPPTPPIGTPPGGTCDPLTQLCNPLKSRYGTLCQVLVGLLTLITEIGALIAVILIIWTGFKFITAQGNPAKLGEAKRAFFAVIIGTAILLGASAIANVVVRTVFTITSQDNPGVCRI